MHVPSKPDPAPTQPAHDRIYRSLRGRIMYGEIAPGCTLTLRGIGAQYGLSTTPAREAVRRLAAEGALSLSASGRVTTPELSFDRIEELTALRSLVEVELACRALPRAHLALIDRMEAQNALMDGIVARDDATRYIRSNLDFHRMLYLRAQAPAMLAMAETVWLQLGPTIRTLYVRSNRTGAPAGHRPILAALRAGEEPALRLAVRADVTKGLRMIFAAEG